MKNFISRGLQYNKYDTQLRIQLAGEESLWYKTTVYSYYEKIFP